MGYILWNIHIKASQVKMNSSPNNWVWHRFFRWHRWLLLLIEKFSTLELQKSESLFSSIRGSWSGYFLCPLYEVGRTCRILILCRRSYLQLPTVFFFKPKENPIFFCLFSLHFSSFNFYSKQLKSISHGRVFSFHWLITSHKKHKMYMLQT